MFHQMKLQDAPFRAIAEGRKTIELRLYDEKRRAIALGDEILFAHAGDPARTLACRVVALYRFPSFEALYRALPLEKCGYAADELATASPADMAQYYAREEEERYGVVGIEMERV